MKDKLEKNMYVRTDLGEIGKITSVASDDVLGTGEMTFYNSEPYLKGNETKASYNIIDLIEEDDLIKCQFGEQTLILQVGARYTTLYPENGFIKGVFTPNNEFLSLEVLVEEDILQSIVTKEQFESMEYKVC